MKRIYVNKHFTHNTSLNILEIWDLVAMDVIVPIFDSFNNTRYARKITSTSAIYGIYPSEYLFEVENSSTMFLVILANNRNNYGKYPQTIRTQWANSPTPAYDTFFYTANIERSQSTTLSDNGMKWGFEIYYITDEFNNLVAFWEINSLTSYYNCYPTVIVTTASGRKGVVIFTNGVNQLVFFYLDDPNYTPYYISQDFMTFNESEQVIKLNYLPLRIGTESHNLLVDIIDSKILHINNVLLEAYCSTSLSTNGMPFIRKLIKVDGKYYRQLVGNWWVEDPKKDEAVTKILDPGNLV